MGTTKTRPRLQLSTQRKFYELLTSPGTEVTNRIPERRGSMGLMEIFRGQYCRREKC